MFSAENIGKIAIRCNKEITYFVLTEEITLSDILKETNYPKTGQFYIKNSRNPLELDVPLIKQGIGNTEDIECIFTFHIIE